MLSEHEALELILADIQPLGEEIIPLGNALDRISARDLTATIPLPGFDNSAMDGYAVRAEDTRSDKSLRVIGEQAAGLAGTLSVQPGTALRIFTGAPMPRGADAVIMQEDVEKTASPEAGIICKEPVEAGENVRVQGCDLCVGQTLVRRSEVFTPARLALLASQGLAKASVFSLPKVAVVTTGDELVMAGSALQPGQIYNSNQILLKSLVMKAGLPVSAISCHHLKDDFEETKSVLQRLISEHDFVILSGGVSVGDHDLVKPALQAIGVSPAFWRIAVKPGKPLLYCKADRPGESGVCHIFGLPGNPVSSFVTFLLFVRPALLKAQGADAVMLALPKSSAIVDQPLKNKGDRPHYLRGHLDTETGKFSATGLQESHALYALSRANALLRLAPGEEFAVGAAVTVHRV